MKTLGTLLLIAFLFGGSLWQINLNMNPGSYPQKPTAIPAAFGGDMHFHGVNIGNALDAPNLGEWGVNIKPEYFEKIRIAGFNTVRLPVRFSMHLQQGPEFKIDSKFMELVDKFVDIGLHNGLIIILDIHHFDEIMQDPTGQEARFLALWKQLASHYQDYPENLYFELLNEPSRNLGKDRWNTLLESTIRIIRDKNPNRWILVDGSEYSDIEMLPTLKLPADNHLIATYHFYEPFPFTHQGASWVEGASKWKGTTWKGSEEEKQAILVKLDRVALWSQEHKTPLVMGEFGVIDQADRESRLRWTEFLAREAEKRNIGWIHWQFCSDFPVYSCNTDQWDQDVLRALIPDSD